MTMAQRAYRDDSDKLRMAALVHADSAEHTHVVDLPYRLSSWAFDDPENVCLWEDERGQLLAWAMLQFPFWTIDYAYHSAAPATLHQQTLAWADARAKLPGDSSPERPMWFVNVFEWQQQRRQDLDGAGFASQADIGDNSWFQLILERSVDIPAPEAHAPSGFSIRSLHGPAEVEAYVALHRTVFQSENMTTAWRLRTLQHPAYRPDLDLIAVAPDGRFAGFCVCWFDPHGIDGRPSGQIEPLGVHQDFQGQGLARAILAEGVQRLHSLGAERVLVETDNYRPAAIALYEGMGFRISQKVLVYRKDYPPKNG
jgi:ribosomal protein S18 acetylase RimI-like enzyme